RWWCRRLPLWTRFLPRVVEATTTAPAGDGPRRLGGRASDRGRSWSPWSAKGRGPRQELSAIPATCRQAAPGVVSSRGLRERRLRSPCLLLPTAAAGPAARLASGPGGLSHPPPPECRDGAS